jgi:Right handed beta helix region
VSDRVRRRRRRGGALGVLLLALVLGACSTNETVVTPSPAGADTGQDAVAGAAREATVYVDRDSIGGPCSDSRSASGASTPATPWCSLGRAVAKAPSGTTVMVRRGAYPRLDIANVRRTSYVTLRSFPGEQAVLDSFSATNASYFRIQGFRIAGRTNLIFTGNDHIQVVGNDMTVSTHVRPSRNITFSRNRVHDLPGPPGRSEDGFGIWVITGDQGPIRNVVIRGNRFSNLPNDGVQTDADNVRIEDNVFERIHSPDHDWSHADIIQSLGTDGMRIRGNFARDNDAGILTSSERRVSGWVIENNVILRSESWPLQLDNIQNDLRVANNTFWGGGPVLMRWNDGFPRNRRGFIFVNNIFSRFDLDPQLNVRVADYNIVGENPFRDSVEGSHSRLGVSPRFLDLGKDDVRLGAGSPAIDAGTSRYAVPRRDRRGARRQDDRSVSNRGGGRIRYVDVGAYERGSSSGAAQAAMASKPARRPSLRASAASRQSASRGLRVVVRCSARCAVRAGATVGWNELVQGIELQARGASLRRAGRVAVRIPVGPRVQSRIRGVLRRGGVVRGAIGVTVRYADGRHATRVVRVRLRR